MSTATMRVGSVACSQCPTVRTYCVSAPLAPLPATSSTRFHAKIDGCSSAASTAVRACCSASPRTRGGGENQWPAPARGAPRGGGGGGRAGAPRAPPRRPPPARRARGGREPVARAFHGAHALPHEDAGGVEPVEQRGGQRVLGERRSNGSG